MKFIVNDVSNEMKPDFCSTFSSYSFFNRSGLYLSLRQLFAFIFVFQGKYNNFIISVSYLSHNIKTLNYVSVFRDKLSVADQFRIANAHSVFSFSIGRDLIHSRDRSFGGV